MKFKSATRIVALALFAAALVWVLARLEWHELRYRLSSASSTDLAIMFAVWLSVLLLRPVRFQYLLNVLGRVNGADYRTIWAAMVLGAAVNTFVPLRAGDVVVALFLRRRLGVELHQSLAVIVADWVCDFACVAAIFLGALAWAPAMAAWTVHAVAVVVALVFVGVAGLWCILRWRSRVLALLDLALARTIPRWRLQGVHMAEETIAGLATIGTWKIASPLLLLSALIWSLTWLSYWFGLHAVFAEAPPAGAAFNMTAVALSFVVPLGPGGLGAFETASVLALTMFDVPLEASVAFALLAHFFQLGSVVLLAALAVLTRQFSYRALLGRAEIH